MANVTSIMNKVARNAQILGLTVSAQTASSVTISNGSNALVVSYVLASILSPMGGVDPAVSPYLGIGIANPGQIQLQSSINTNGNITDVIDGVVAAQVLQLLSGFANDILLKNSDSSFSARLRGDADLIGMGQ
jgi:hypothetical protein